MKNKETELDIVDIYFPDIYLTIISLIQGIALAVLAENFVEDIKLIEKAGLSGSVDIYYLRYIIASTVIFTTWHHYMYGVVCLRWFPGLLDTLIPFLLGASQFVITGIIREPNQYYWLISLSLFFLLAALAYINAAFKTNPRLFSAHYGDDLSVKYSQYIKRCNMFAGISGFVHAIITFMIAYQEINPSMLCFIEMILFFHIFAYEYYYTKKIKPHYILMLHARKTGLSKNIPE